MADMEILWIFALGVGGIYLLIVTLTGTSSTGDDTIQRRLRQLKQEAQPQMPEWARAIADEEKKSRRDLKDVMQHIPGISAGYWEQVERTLAQADIPMRPSEWLLLRFALVVVPAIIGYAFSGMITVAAGAAVVGFMIPGLMLSIKANGRVGKFNNQLADFLTLVVNGLRAGQTFLQGVDHAVRESPHPLSTEFKLLLQETNLGLPVDTAFQNLCQRVPSQDLEITATAFIIQKNVGGNLAEVMEKVAATIRERVRLQGQIRVLTAQGMMSGFLVGSLPIGLLVILYGLNPDYMRILFEEGLWLLGLAACMQAIGAYAIKQIITIDI